MTRESRIFKTKEQLRNKFYVRSVVTTIVQRLQTAGLCFELYASKECMLPSVYANDRDGLPDAGRRCWLGLNSSSSQASNGGCAANDHLEAKRASALFVSGSGVSLCLCHLCLSSLHLVHPNLRQPLVLDQLETYIAAMVIFTDLWSTERRHGRKWQRHQGG